MAARFVILHHRLDKSEHWDLMLEQGGSLVTWQLSEDPISAAPMGEIRARRIENHRLAYLGYEGPVSGNRGTVTRIESGAVEIAELGESECRFTLRGTQLSGPFLLETLSGPDWTFRRA